MIVILHQNQTEPLYCDSNTYVAFRPGRNSSIDTWYIRTYYLDHTGKKIYYWKTLI